VPAFLIYSGIPPFLATRSSSPPLGPMGGLALLACRTIMVIVLNVLLRDAN
jgi:hypothetical protein